MGGWELEKHQPEPWSLDGRHVVSASGWRLAKAVILTDARRIVAAVNDTQGIPTAALEAGFIRDLLELKVWPRAIWEGNGQQPMVSAPGAFLDEPLDPPQPFSFERRVGDRRRGQRRRNGLRGR
ncbi:MAG TPA: hypothetical protein VEG84_10570 [Thermoanaerobaculia bacterium]|nr:hypothetical protein [Thermoanaerobaculia bacterium]